MPTHAEVIEQMARDNDKLRAALRDARDALNLSHRAWAGLMVYDRFDNRQQEEWFTLRGKAREAIPVVLAKIAEVLPE